MANGGAGAVRTIRVTLEEGTGGEADLGALKKWLEREPGLEDLADREALRIELRTSAETTGTPMGAGMEILIVVLGVVGQPLFNDVYQKVKQGVNAWRENRRSVEPAPEPQPLITPDPDGE